MFKLQFDTLAYRDDAAARKEIVRILTEVATSFAAIQYTPSNISRAIVTHDGYAIGAWEWTP